MSPLVTSALLVIALSVFGYTMFWRLKSLVVLKASIIPRFDRIPERIDALMQVRPRPEAHGGSARSSRPGLMHVFIFAAFLVLQAAHADDVRDGLLETALDRALRT